uniref:Uncharacterized protein n=1 Tax=Zea mays TaxID=4577 RepID=A0A804RPR0_MAIZE
MPATATAATPQATPAATDTDLRGVADGAVPAVVAAAAVVVAGSAVASGLAGMEASRASGSAAAAWGLKKVCISGVVVASSLPLVKSPRPWDSDRAASSAATLSANSRLFVLHAIARFRRSPSCTKRLAFVMEKGPARTEGEHRARACLEVQSLEGQDLFIHAPVAPDTQE